MIHILRFTNDEYYTIKNIEDLYKSTLSLELIDYDDLENEEKFYDEETDEYVNMTDGIDYLLDLINADDRELFHTLTQEQQETFIDLCVELGFLHEGAEL